MVAALLTGGAIGDDDVPSADRSAAQARPEAPATQHSPLTNQDLEAWLDGLLPGALRREGIAGAVVVVVKDGEVLLQKGYGYADMAARQPVDPARTLFRPGSNSKLFTATAAMQLVEQERLDLDADINRYLDFTIPPAFGQPITLRHLLTHTAGLEDSVRDLLFDDETRLQPLGAYVREHLPARIDPPGRVPAYSNYGMALVGYVVERVAGVPFEEYVERHIFQPLGMEHSTFRQPVPQPLRADLSKGYYPSATSEPRAFEFFGPAPAGALTSTGADMARFMIAHLQQGRYANVHILRPETARLMHSRALFGVPINSMALGFMEYDTNGRRIIGHDGGTPTYRTNLRLLPEENAGLFMSFNTASPAVQRLRSSLLQLFFDRYFSGEAADPAAKSTMAAANAQSIAGTYDASARRESGFMSLLNLDQTVIAADASGALTLSTHLDAAGNAKPWRPIQEFVWREADGEKRLWAKTRDGRVLALGLSDDQAGGLVPAPGWRAASWNVPLLIATIAMLSLAAIRWPLVTLMRRKFRVPAPARSSQRSMARLAEAAAPLNLAVLVCWIGLLWQLPANNVQMFTESLDPWLRLLRFLAIAGLAGTIAAVGQARRVVGGVGGWASKSWSVLVAAACVAAAWFFFAFKLLSAGIEY